MAMIKCRECGASISSTAAACPHCGAKPTYRPSAVFVLIVAGLALFAIRGLTLRDAPPAPPKTAAQQASDWRHQMGAAAIVSIKKRLDDPDSLEIVHIYTDDAATTVCVKYRARNTFGGYSTALLIVNESGEYDTATAWNAHCTAQMHDVTAVKHLL